MVQYLSGSMAVEGLTDGIDFKGMIDKLKTIEMQKANRLFKWKTEWQQRLEGFQNIRTQMVSLQSKLKAMDTVDKFLVKNAASSQSEVAKATAGNATSKGVYNLEVNKLANYASCSYQTNLTNKNDKINAGISGTFEYTYKGKTHTMNVPSDTTLQGFVNMINNDSQNPGVVAQIVPGQGGKFLFQLRGKDTGRDASLTIDKVDNISGMTLNATDKWTNGGGKTDILGQYFHSANDVLVPSTTPPVPAADRTFTLTMNGSTSHSIVLNPGETIGDLSDKIQALGYTVNGYTSPSANDNRLWLEIESGNPADTFTLTQNSTGNSVTNFQEFTDFNQVINPNDTPRDFIFTAANGNKTTVTLAAGATVGDLYDAINSQANSTGVRAVVNTVGGSGSGKFTLSLQGATTGDVTTIDGGSLTNFSTGKNNNDWQVTEGSNAEIRYNNWPAEPEWLEVASNTLTDLLDRDLTVNLYSTGKTTITVDIDSTAIYKNVEEFVDAVNAMRKMLNDLTKWDESKTTYAAEYADNQFDMQKGSVLTGNYGVQIIASRFKSICGGSALGFMPREITKNPVTGDVLSDIGDIFNSLSQIGIMTNADQGGEMYGLLEINTVEDNKLKTLTLEQAIKKDPEAVARLFAAKGEGYSTDARFGHVSHIDGITNPGLYDVKYDIAADGTVTGTINGKTMVKGEGNTYGIYDTSPPPNAADGMVIEIYDLTLSSSVSSQIGVRQGKVNELLATMDGAQGYLGKEGTLAILEDNYKDIMKNIDDKIFKEDERIIKWERTIRARFSRIEATIAVYQKLNEQVKSQIAQLSNKSS